MSEVQDIEKFCEGVDGLTEDQARTMAYYLESRLSVPWQPESGGGNVYIDPDGAPLGLGSSEKTDLDSTREALQHQCWIKAHRNPQVSTSIADRTGRMAGMGFETCSDVWEIQEAIKEIEFDPRNRLWSNWRAFVARSRIEGELFLCLTCHEDGFIEVDFIDPMSVTSSSEETGIIWHPRKPCFPLAFFVKMEDELSTELIPSINIAYFPENLKPILQSHESFRPEDIRKSINRNFRKIGGYEKFIVSWDMGYMTKRNVGYVRSVLEWITHYENIKKYEIDHKKSAGAFAWVYKFEDWKHYLKWLALSDEDKRKTPMGAKITPGSRVVIPPGVDLTAKNPNLPNISDSDTDIMHQITAGLNDPEDVSTGQAKGTFASVKASRGPMSDRISDDIAYFERFLKYDFWRAVFFLKSKISDFPETFERNEAIDFDEDGEPVFKKLKKRAWELVEFNFPTTEVSDPESRAKAFYGVKHGSLYDTAGVPNATLLKRMGFGNYRRLRLDHATEEQRFPKLIPTVDAESWQEKTRGEKRGVANQENDDLE